MYSKQQASQIRQSFWTTFGQYMSPILSADGEKINWINYKTGVKHVYFKLNADQKFASVEIQITHPALDEQKKVFDQFASMKNMLHETLNENWDWVLHTADENEKVVSRIFVEIAGKNIYNKEDWPALISFFKPRLISLDEFWSQAQYGFQPL